VGFVVGKMALVEFSSVVSSPLHFSITSTNLLMLFREIIYVQSDNRTEPINKI
jgi:hypothetical protein